METKSQTKLYEELIQSIINRQIEILGVMVAVDRAKKVEDLWVDQKGKVLQVKGPHLPVLQSLINEYYHLTTDAGLDSCINVIREHLKTNQHLILPEEVQVLLKDES